MVLLEYSPELYIPFTDIALATNNFQNIIGKGGYGPVYKGELLVSGELAAVAVKRLQISELSGQGLKEFLTEIQLLSCYKHSNLVSLLGFCEENNEKVLVYEYAKHGSLDRYLRPVQTKCPLTWKQRINISIDAARGLNYLHNHVAENHRIIHRDIKSANILLDHNWKGMIADLGLSKIGRANEDVTYLITNACGTRGYCDPAYMETGVLTDKSDVYSFGVVLFELLCGRLCFIDNVDPKQRFLPQLARRLYEEKRLNIIIDPDLENHMNSESVKEFSDLAYHCLQPDREQRPSMGLVVQILEESLKLLEFEETSENQNGESWMVYEALKAISKRQDIPSKHITRGEIYQHLSTGILVDEDKVWISIDENGKSRVMISATNLIYLDGKKCVAVSIPKQRMRRFPKVAQILDPINLNARFMIRTHSLSMGVTYAAYLVLKTTYLSQFDHTCLRYRLNGKSESFSSSPSEWLDNRWLMIELFQTTISKKTAYFEVMLDGFDISPVFKQEIHLEGIEFVPINKFDGDEIEKSYVEHQSISNMEWDDHLPSDYAKFMYYSNKGMRKTNEVDVTFPNKEEAYSTLSRGVLIDVDCEVPMWFWITKSYGKKCFMLPPILSLDSRFPAHAYCKLIPSKESRFKHVLESAEYLSMGFKFRKRLLSTNTTYACYLVYKIPQGLVYYDPVKVTILARNCFTFVERSEKEKLIYLMIPQIPVIGLDSEKRCFNSLNKPKTGSFPSKRKDGWWEVNLGELISNYQEALEDSLPWIPKCVLMCLEWMFGNEAYIVRRTVFPTILIGLTSMTNDTHPRLIVQGIEFRPI